MITIRSKKEDGTRVQRRKGVKVEVEVEVEVKIEKVFYSAVVPLSR